MRSPSWSPDDWWLPSNSNGPWTSFPAPLMESGGVSPLVGRGCRTVTSLAVGDDAELVRPFVDMSGRLSGVCTRCVGKQGTRRIVHRDEADFEIFLPLVRGVDGGQATLERDIIDRRRSVSRELLLGGFGGGVFVRRLGRLVSVSVSVFGIGVVVLVIGTLGYLVRTAGERESEAPQCDSVQDTSSVHLSALAPPSAT